MKKRRRLCVAFDLDGTLADYRGGWKIHSEFPGDPLPGTEDNLRRLHEAGIKIGILTTRNKEIVEEWLHKHGLHLFVDWVNENPDQPVNTGIKPIADHYVDDRGIRFEGDLAVIVDGIINKEYVPWQEKE